MKTLTKEEIKDRLIRRAAETWGVDDIEIEFSFDPMVSILFDACAHEFERISDTVKASRTRITERLVDLLTPEISVTAKPAHAVMHALPVDAHIDINERSQFYHRKRMPIFRNNGKNDFEDYFFSPAGDFTLNNCELKYVVHPNKVVKYENHREVPFLSESELKQNTETSCIYLGIRPAPGLIELNQLLCYFDVLNFSQKELLAHHINIASWSLNGTELNVVRGYNDKTDNLHSFSGYINESIQSKQRFYEEHVKQFYKNHFYTIDSTINVAENTKHYPENFKDFITKEGLNDFKQPLLWIRISFSSVVSQQMLDNLHCHINCFPVLNKKAHETNKRLQSYLNILPLNVDDDYFFDVQKIEGDSGNIYFIQNREKTDDDNPNAYLRYGGVSRFDERDASELLNYTLDLLKEDSVAFSAINDDFIDSNIKDLKKTVSRIEQQIELRDFKKNKVPYLIINKNSIDKNKDDVVFASYWTTAGEKANKIHPHTKLVQYSGTAFMPNSLVFITGTVGGRDEPTASEKIYAYREHVLSKGKVITRQDIVQYCYSIFRESVSNIQIKKGVMVGQQEGIGYMPTTDIHITKNIDASYTEEDWEHLKKELLIGLENRSANILPFRIFYVN
ncbi:type VI secretion system baseplate subunit TssF [Costertonia aggregata]|uniref:Type VI secretion system baseplate subunit TssF n=1 Tax=Costertonia aggregata TaxID=343403 RepID=A0A7H9ATQ8_9FLAO|nr:type VI secretion system baseplate subunit TssF [Costertonia aggregata]QLG46844.1 type VI secretion system baseplate subunit TssF [Costertonia aggregata]